jgi:hypothetical protein
VHAVRSQAFPVLVLMLMGFILTFPSPGDASRADAAVPQGAGLRTGSGAAAFGLLPPVKIAYCDEYPEDGTIGVALLDRRGTKFLCGVDGGCGASIASGRQPASRPRRLFVGDTYPARPGVKTLPLWGAEERSLLQLLAGAIADSISDAQNDFLLKRASAGDLEDPGGIDFLRLLGRVERRRRMLAAVSAGEVAPAPDAFAYFGFRGPVAVQRIRLDQSGQLSSIAVSDTAGLSMAASVKEADAGTGGGAWSVDLGGSHHDLYVPLGGYEERYLLTVLSTALRAFEGQGSPRTEGFSPGGPRIDAKALKAALRTIQARKDQVLERDRFK